MHVGFSIYELIILCWLLSSKPYYCNNFNPAIDRNGRICEVFNFRGLSLAYNAHTYEKFRGKKLCKIPQYAIHSFINGLGRFAPMAILIWLYMIE